MRNLGDVGEIVFLFFDILPFVTSDGMDFCSYFVTPVELLIVNKILL